MDFTIEQLENGNFVIKGKGVYQDIDFVNGGVLSSQEQAQVLLTIMSEQYRTMHATNKINLLKFDCEKAIEEGFVSAVNGHKYRTNRDDQANFMGQKEELNDNPEISNVDWKTEDAGYLSHSREEWILIFYEGLQHKKNQLFKYDRLKNQVLQATTDSEIDIINW